MVFASLITRTINRPSVTRTSTAIARRHFGAAGASRPRPKEYGGFLAPPVKPIHKYTGDGMMLIMWLWIFYQTKNNWKVLLGFEHPWDAHGDHGHHDDHHHEPEWTFEIGKTPTKGEH